MHVWHKHSDLVSSTGILAVTTCLLAAKIFPRIPAILPRLSLVILNFTGVIWLNIQVREIKKSAADLQLALKIKDLSGATLTAAKVMVKGINALLTCGLFAASVVAFCGFPQTTAIMYLGMRPFAIFSLATGIFCDISDYFVNNRLLEKLRVVKETVKIAQNFLSVIFPKESRAPLDPLAVQVARQIDLQVLETFQETLQDNAGSDKIFSAIKDSLVSKQTGTEKNLSLIALGYIAMGICRIFPDTLADTGTRWIMSLLYTEELIRQKLFQCDLQETLAPSS